MGHLIDAIALLHNSGYAIINSIQVKKLYAVIIPPLVYY